MSELDSTRRVAMVAHSSGGGRGAKKPAGVALRRDSDGEKRNGGAVSPLISTPRSEACDNAAACAERELQEAIVKYQRSSGRMFPTWSEVLEIVRDLGYRKPVEEDAVA